MCWRSLFLIKLQGSRCFPANTAQSPFTPIVQWSYFYIKLLNNSVWNVSTERNIYTEKFQKPQISNLCNACRSYRTLRLLGRHTILLKFWLMASKIKLVRQNYKYFSFLRKDPDVRNILKIWTLFIHICNPIWCTTFVLNFRFQVSLYSVIWQQVKMTPRLISDQKSPVQIGLSKIYLYQFFIEVKARNGGNSYNKNNWYT